MAIASFVHPPSWDRPHFTPNLSEFNAAQAGQLSQAHARPPVIADRAAVCARSTILEKPIMRGDGAGMNLSPLAAIQGILQ
jgi:hypothetical protein